MASPPVVFVGAYRDSKMGHRLACREDLDRSDESGLRYPLLRQIEACRVSIAPTAAAGSFLYADHFLRYRSIALPRFIRIKNRA